MRVLVCGSRQWSNRATIRSWLTKLKDFGYDTLVEGEAVGADSIAREEGEALGLTILSFPANWAKFGRAAGYIRNSQMLLEGQPNLVIYFSLNLEASKGTKNMVEQATKAGVPVIDGNNLLLLDHTTCTLEE